VVVVDDLTMGINTVIRGDDHVMNTPKQILLYRALGVPLPVFGHVPMVLGKDRSRLSKRHGAMSVTEYRDMGYLPDALLNYLVRLGWSHGDQEFFTRAELIEKFSLENIGRSAGVFDPDKLKSLNADHMKAVPPNMLAGYLTPFLEKRGVEVQEGRFIEGVIKTLIARSKTLEELAEKALFYFQESVVYDPEAARKFLKPEAKTSLLMLNEQLESLTAFDEKNLENAFLQVMEQTGLKLGKIAQPVRVALTGKTASPGIFEIIEVLGKEKVLTRLKDAVGYIDKNSP
jgi:glutamyl-tRNA synthetase